MDNNVFQMDRSRRGGSNSGNGGSGMSGDLEKRVEKLEASIGDIKQDLAVLKTRSENFSTKSDLMELSNTLKTEQQALRIELHQSIASIQKEISNQTKWVAGTIIAVAALSLTVAKVLF